MRVPVIWAFARGEIHSAGAAEQRQHIKSTASELAPIMGIGPRPGCGVAASRKPTPLWQQTEEAHVESGKFARWRFESRQA